MNMYYTNSSMSIEDRKINECKDKYNMMNDMEAKFYVFCSIFKEGGFVAVVNLVSKLACYEKKLQPAALG